MGVLENLELYFQRGPKICISVASSWCPLYLEKGMKRRKAPKRGYRKVVSKLLLFLFEAFLSYIRTSNLCFLEKIRVLAVKRSRVSVSWLMFCPICSPVFPADKANPFCLGPGVFHCHYAQGVCGHNSTSVTLVSLCVLVYTFENILRRDSYASQNAREIPGTKKGRSRGQLNTHMWKPLSEADISVKIGSVSYTYLCYCVIPLPDFCWSPVTFCIWCTPYIWGHELLRWARQAHLCHWPLPMLNLEMWWSHLLNFSQWYWEPNGVCSKTWALLTSSGFRIISLFVALFAHQSWSFVLKDWVWEMWPPPWLFFSPCSDPPILITFSQDTHFTDKKM